MNQVPLLDAGPLVALLDRRDEHHRWALEQMSGLRPPFRTCEAVVAESFYLLRDLPEARKAALEMITKGVITIPFQLSEQSREVLTLIERYANVPMSLADACLVRMSELLSDCVVFTLDTDFAIYRRHRRQKIPLLIPHEL
ncbi:MAG: PIN domain-containing protein [Planctomycetes bacterium]|nr:PIN domain-containing protein [Planctomycetota bacterium]